jgi:hypothetical protein
MVKQNAKTRISDVHAKMRKSDRCDAMKLSNSANAMRMQKMICITSPVEHSKAMNETERRSNDLERSKFRQQVQSFFCVLP